MQNLIGHQLDRYHITERLGQGGMAVVYKAYDVRLERNVAIKLIRTDSSPQDKASRLIHRFEREAQAMARLLHPNIVQVMDYGDFEGVPYLVMPFLPGGTLKEYTKNPIAYNRAANLLAPMADALAYAHSQGIIHRDVKPANILITESGTPMLSDFGIAKILEEQDISLTSTGLSVGTPQYMAPEQWRNDICPQTDIYALGTILYELITGQRPYDAETPAAIAVKQATEPLIRPRNFILDLPEEVEKIIFKALAYKPENRYFDMRTFHSKLADLSQRVNIHETQTYEENSRQAPIQTYEFAENSTIDQLVTGQKPQGKLASKKQNNRKPWLIPTVVISLLLCLVIAVFGMTKVLSIINNTEKEPTSAIQKPTEQVNENTQKSTIAPIQSSATSEVFTSTAAHTSTKVLSIGSSQTREADGMLMMYIPAGSFLMGSNASDSDASSDEKPQHEVYLDSFWMDAYEVSNEMFAKFVTETGYQTASEKQGFSYMYNSSGSWGEFSGVNWRHPMGSDTNAENVLPVVHINYFDASAYCSWIGGRLPTEAEWEKAARGEDGRMYPWGDQFNPNLLRFNSTGGPVSVYSYPEGKSPYGVYNMSGNVFEWTKDWYSADYYVSSPNENPTGPVTGDLIALRSGGWNNSQRNVRITNRDVSGPDYMNYLLGFRCVTDMN
jgi:serine/threonine protein kinase